MLDNRHYCLSDLHLVPGLFSEKDRSCLITTVVFFVIFVNHQHLPLNFNFLRVKLGLGFTCLWARLTFGPLPGNSNHTCWQSSHLRFILMPFTSLSLFVRLMKTLLLQLGCTWRTQAVLSCLLEKKKKICLNPFSFSSMKETSYTCLICPATSS